MNQLTMPSKNNPILPWAQEATRQIRAMTQSGAAGMLVRAGVSGSGSEPIPANQRIHRSLSCHPWAVRRSCRLGFCHAIPARTYIWKRVHF